MAVTIRCKDHPKYKAVYHPKVMCNACWYMWHVATHIKQSDDYRLQIKRRGKWK